MAVRLMIVDDAEDSRFLMRVIVGDVPGVEVVGEADGADSALEQLDALSPDVVVLDAMMPLVDGYELAVMLRARRAGVRLILFTAHVDDVVRERAAAAGFDLVLGKDEFDRVPDAVLGR